MQNDIINKNYADYIIIPKSEKQEKKTFSDIEIQKLENDICPYTQKRCDWSSTILILIYTGMRISELLSLTRFNIDMENQIITGGIKTDAGKNRVIPIHPKITEHIKYWLNKNGETIICRNEKKINVRYYRDNFYYTVLERLDIRS